MEDREAEDEAADGCVSGWAEDLCRLLAGEKKSCTTCVLLRRRWEEGALEANKSSCSDTSDRMLSMAMHAGRAASSCRSTETGASSSGYSASISHAILHGGRLLVRDEFDCNSRNWQSAAVTVAE